MEGVQRVRAMAISSRLYYYDLIKALARISKVGAGFVLPSASGWSNNLPDYSKQRCECTVLGLGYIYKI